MSYHNYPPGAANDPRAPYNQVDPEAIYQTETFTQDFENSDIHADLLAFMATGEKSMDVVGDFLFDYIKWDYLDYWTSDREPELEDVTIPVFNVDADTFEIKIVIDYSHLPNCDDYEYMRDERDAMMEDAWQR